MKIPLKKLIKNYELNEIDIYIYNVDEDGKG